MRAQDGVDKSRLSPYINLQGVAIGNGVIDDVIQSASYTEYAYTHGLIPLGAKRKIDEMQGRCVEAAADRTMASADDETGDCNVMGSGAMLCYRQKITLLTHPHALTRD